ncbi:MAG TPA: M23 family metallopeptidase [Candidatus Cryptobacteroides excrementigallinarum]|nr:M23 family metallopeptidase [Candidatus Cryptobacteroides excrementigallinarum]
MAKYVLNPETLTYDSPSESRFRRPLRAVLLVLLGAALVCFYFWLYVSVLGLDLPKTALLKRRHAQLEARINVLNTELDRSERALYGIESRDDDVYRSIYGLSPVPEAVRHSGLEGVNRYAELERLGANSTLKRTVLRADALMKRVYVNSKSLDEVSQAAVQSGDMMSCVPNVPPILPEPGTFFLSSRFGYRTDPVYGDSRRHQGQDFASFTGNPVYATGDAVVEKVTFQYHGYGNEIVLDHGYGYETRYAHLNTIEVAEGMKVHRGDRIGTLGNTGKSTGPHLHYEVIYMGGRVNPMNYMDIDMPVEEYQAMVDRRRGEYEDGHRMSTMELLRRGRAENGGR